MGTLDDAIREHLELKKRHGAPQEEVARLEAEAFGPVRREPPAPADESATAAGEPDAASAEADYDPANYRPPSEEAAGVAEAAEADLPSEPLAEAPAAPPEPAPAPDVTVAAEPPPVPPADPPPPSRPADESWLEEDEPPQQTSEFTAAEAAEAGGRPPTDYVAPDEEGEDLLEETPDFLQETPEHDRLWFEQRPPRDFDFDE